MELARIGSLGFCVGGMLSGAGLCFGGMPSFTTKSSSSYSSSEDLTVGLRTDPNLSC